MSLPPDEMRKVYRATFSGRTGELVIEDLERFCHAHLPTTVTDQAGRIDPLAMAAAEGRRQVLMMIRNRLRERPDEGKTNADAPPPSPFA